MRVRRDRVHSLPGQHVPDLPFPRILSPLNHLLLRPLARFSLMGQVHALEIHFERQPGQVRTVSNSKQSFGNSADCFPHHAFVLLRIGDVRQHTHLGNGVPNVVVRKASSRVRRIARLRRCSITIVTRAVTTTASTTAAAVALTYQDVFPYHRTALSATPMTATTTP